MYYSTAKYAVILVFVLLGSACATSVKPWERGELARKEMGFIVDPMETAIEEHIHFSKEGSSSGSAVSGGGCGCN